MNKVEYIQALARLIKNRVVFHAPIRHLECPDYDLLDLVGLDKSLPIFKFSKPMSDLLCKAFVRAQKEVDFNLVITDKNCKKRLLKKLKNLFVMDEENSPPLLVALIDALNINYLSHSAFIPSLNERYMKINGQDIVLDFQQFFLHKKAQEGGVVYEIKQFLLNGSNFSLNFFNPHEDVRKISFEINIPLPSGYYNFSRVKTGVKIVSLTSGDVAYFNYDARQGRVKFSCIDGLENSTRACVNLRLDLSLNPRAQKRFFFNFGDKAYLFSSPRDIDEFFRLSQEKTFSMFDIKVSSQDKAFDQKLNLTLPKKIWTAWSNLSSDDDAEREYLAMRAKVVKRQASGYLLNENFKGLKIVKIFHGGAFRHVFIVKGDRRYLMADRTRFFNFSLISDDFFKSTSEIYLCFGH